MRCRQVRVPNCSKNVSAIGVLTARIWRLIEGEEKVTDTAICPECEMDVYVEEDMQRGDVLTCEECGTDLEVLSTDPPEVRLYDETEEYEDEFDDEDFEDDDDLDDEDEEDDFDYDDEDEEERY